MMNSPAFLHQPWYTPKSLALAALLSLSGLALQAASIIPGDLRCENRSKPSGNDVPAPRLSWLLSPASPTARGLHQSAWQVLAASSPELLLNGKADLWDTGKISGDQSLAIPYAGKPLASGQTVFWKLRVWDQSNEASDWSAIQSWTNGLLSDADWGGSRWIGSADNTAQSLLLRRDFTVKPGLRRALLFVTGLGHYEAALNGSRIGDELLAPGWTDYRKTVVYATHDVTSLLRPGANTAALTLGNGMYEVLKTKERYNKFEGSQGPKKAIALLRLEYADGSVATLNTDSSWLTHPGPLTYSNTYGGEDRDNRLYPENWDKPGFSAGAWSPALETSGPGGRLTGLSMAALPIRPAGLLKPVSTKELRPGLLLVDLGRNVSLMPRLTASGPAGSSIRIRPSELLKDNGDIDDVMTSRKAYWTLTLAGKGTESWFPQFFYRGARYLEVELLPAEKDGPLPSVLSLEGVIVHAETTPVGSFSCSSELFNRLNDIVLWAQKSNAFSVLTDCPHREKLGWLEQDYLNGPALRYNLDLVPLFEKTVGDIADAQQPDGLVPNIAPEFVVFGKYRTIQFRESPEWGSAFIQVAWQHYLFTGDDSLIRRHYPAMARYMAYLGTHVKPDGILRLWGSLGDWYDVSPAGPGESKLTPIDLTGSAIFHDNAKLMARFARLLGKSEDASSFDALTTRTREDFNRAYLNPDGQSYATNSQTANAMPLALGLVSEDNRQAVLNSLVADFSEKGVTAGDVGYRYLLRALADSGQNDLIHSVASRTDRPGYGYILAKGATALPEAWDARRLSSQNHFMLGQITEWFYHDLAGIQPDPTAPGFKRIIIRPGLVKGLSWVRADYRSVRGPIHSAWDTDGKRIHLQITLPPNTTGLLHLPVPAGAKVTESGRPLAEVKDLHLVKTEGDRQIYEAVSGTYDFLIIPSP